MMLYIVLLSVKSPDVAETVTRRSRKGMGYSDGIIIPVVSIDIGIGNWYGRERVQSHTFQTIWDKISLWEISPKGGGGVHMILIGSCRYHQLMQRKSQLMQTIFTLNPRQSTYDLGLSSPHPRLTLLALPTHPRHPRFTLEW